jgi:pimeloyl-ACP methyl ester carboxylesterase
MPTIKGNGIDISYDIHEPPTSSVPPASSQTCIVLINGLAGPKETWSLQIPSLTTAGFTVVTFDNRGIGSSSSPPGPYSASLLAADLKSLITHLIIPKFHLMGVSMGG